METNSLTRAHWQEISDRLAATIQDINQQGQPASPGRNVPAQTSLIIGEGKQLHLAILFLDICGFTCWQSGNFTNQKDILTIFNLFMTEMVRIANDYGATVEKNTGDGMMAYFEGEENNKPSSACEHAVAAAETMLYTTTNAINPILRASNLQTVNFRVGIDYGPVTIAKVGSARLFSSLVAIGISANIANKILRDAGPNDIVIGNDVYVRLGPQKRQHCRIYKEHTQFVYTHSSGPNAPYPYYIYTARWIKLT